MMPCSAAPTQPSAAPRVQAAQPRAQHLAGPRDKEACSVRDPTGQGGWPHSPPFSYGQVPTQPVCRPRGPYPAAPTEKRWLERPRETLRRYTPTGLWRTCAVRSRKGNTRAVMSLTCKPAAVRQVLLWSVSSRRKSRDNRGPAANLPSRVNRGIHHVTASASFKATEASKVWSHEAQAYQGCCSRARVNGGLRAAASLQHSPQGSGKPEIGAVLPRAPRAGTHPGNGPTPSLAISALPQSSPGRSSRVEPPASSASPKASPDT